MITIFGLFFICKNFFESFNLPIKEQFGFILGLLLLLLLLLLLFIFFNIKLKFTVDKSL
jgi:hypothetical protein